MYSINSWKSHVDDTDDMNIVLHIWIMTYSINSWKSHVDDDDDINIALHIWIITYSRDKVILGHIQATGIYSPYTKHFRNRCPLYINMFRNIRRILYVWTQMHTILQICRLWGLEQVICPLDPIRSNNHSCKKCFCLREPVFWGRIFLILRRNFPNME